MLKPLPAAELPLHHFLFSKKLILNLQPPVTVLVTGDIPCVELFWLCNPGFSSLAEGLLHEQQDPAGQDQRGEQTEQSDSIGSLGTKLRPHEMMEYFHFSLSESRIHFRQTHSDKTK